MITKVQKKQIFRGFSSVRAPHTVLYDLELIKQDLLNHFSTRKGERVMMPNFGSIIWDKLFDNFDEFVSEAIINDSQEIVEFDPRLRFEDMVIDEFEHGLMLAITITYLPFDITENLTIQFDKRLAEQNF